MFESVFLLVHLLQYIGEGCSIGRSVSVYDGRISLVNGAVVSVTGTRCCYLWDLHNHVHHRFDLLYFLEPGCTIFTNTYQRAACHKVFIKNKKKKNKTQQCTLNIILKIPFVMLTYQRLSELKESNSVMSCMKLVPTIKRHSHLPALILTVGGVVTSIATH